MSAQKAQEKASKLAAAQQSLPYQWVQANIPDIKRLMMEKAQAGENSCELGLEWNTIENKIERYKPIMSNEIFLDSPYHKDFCAAVYKELLKEIAPDRIRLIRSQKEIRYKGKRYTHEQWTLKW
ncbi:hypothetical protein [Bosea vaviloviae]|nr:hypothetical protein [Bosea vaviloviae]